MKPEEAPRKLYLYRIVGGSRVKFCFEVDDNFTILSETPVIPVTAPPAVQTRPAGTVTPEMLASHAAMLRARGYTVELSGGRLNILHTPRNEAIATAFMNGKACDFPGCEELKQRFEQEEAEMKRLITAGECTGCELNKFKARFRETIVQHLNAIAA
jgi:hypothetical protein